MLEGGKPSQTELLKLDFEYINYDFCKQNQFSNEQTSTCLAILDHIFTQMLDCQLKPEHGLKMLREILSDHTSQRPPFSIYIFSQAEVQAIVDFSLGSFLRHFYLYEYAFKPRVELVLRTDIPEKAADVTTVEMLPVQTQPHETTVSAMSHHGQDEVSVESPKHQVEEIDWKKVGRVHAADTAVEDVIGKEMERLHKALDIKMNEQLEDMTRKAGEPPKKK